MKEGPGNCLRAVPNASITVSRAGRSTVLRFQELLRGLHAAIMAHGDATCRVLKSARLCTSGGSKVVLGDLATDLRLGQIADLRYAKHQGLMSGARIRHQFAARAPTTAFLTLVLTSWKNLCQDTRASADATNGCILTFNTPQRVFTDQSDTLVRSD